MTLTEKRFKQLVKTTPLSDLRNVYAFMVRRGNNEPRTRIIEQELMKRK